MKIKGYSDRSVASAIGVISDLRDVLWSMVSLPRKVLTHTSARHVFSWFLNVRWESDENHGSLSLQIHQLSGLWDAFLSGPGSEQRMAHSTQGVSWERSLLCHEVSLQPRAFTLLLLQPARSMAPNVASFSPVPPPLRCGLYHVACSGSFLIVFLPIVSFPLLSILYTAS